MDACREKAKLFILIFVLPTGDLIQTATLMLQHFKCRVEFPATMIRLVEVGDDGLATRQIDLLSDNRMFRYCRRWPSDSNGAISIQRLASIDPDRYMAIAADDFEQIWLAVPDALDQPQDYQNGCYAFVSQLAESVGVDELPEWIRHLFIPRR